MHLASHSVIVSERAEDNIKILINCALKMIFCRASCLNVYFVLVQKLNSGLNKFLLISWWNFRWSSCYIFITVRFATYFVIGRSFSGYLDVVFLNEESKLRIRGIFIYKISVSMNVVLGIIFKFITLHRFHIFFWLG